MFGKDPVQEIRATRPSGQFGEAACKSKEHIAVLGGIAHIAVDNVEMIPEVQAEVHIVAGHNGQVAPNLHCTESRHVARAANTRHERSQIHIGRPRPPNSRRGKGLEQYSQWCTGHMSESDVTRRRISRHSTPQIDEGQPQRDVQRNASQAAAGLAPVKTTEVRQREDRFFMGETDDVMIREASVGRKPRRCRVPQV